MIDWRVVVPFLAMALGLGISAGLWWARRAAAREAAALWSARWDRALEARGQAERRAARARQRLLAARKELTTKDEQLAKLKSERPALEPVEFPFAAALWGQSDRREAFGEWLARKGAERVEAALRYDATAREGEADD